MKKSERRRLAAELAEQGATKPIDLAAGDKRREAMKRSQDELDEAGERRANANETVRFDPSKLKVDYEIVQNLNHLDVTGAQDEYRYCWVRFKSDAGTPLIDHKLTLSVRVDGRVIPCWEVVSGDMPEAKERNAVDNTRRIGDVMLMRCRREIYEALQKAEEIKAQRRMLGAVSDLEAFGQSAKARKYGMRVITDQQEIAELAQGGRRGVGQRPTDEQLRRGTVPGAEIGR